MQEAPSPNQEAREQSQGHDGALGAEQGAEKGMSDPGVNSGCQRRESRAQLAETGPWSILRRMQSPLPEPQPPVSSAAAAAAGAGGVAGSAVMLAGLPRQRSRGCLDSAVAGTQRGRQSSFQHPRHKESLSDTSPAVASSAVW